MERFEVRLTRMAGWGEDVYSCDFEKPEDYEFTPGQYFSIEVDAAAGPLAKPFSHAASPEDDFIELTTHMSDSEFKRALKALEPGDTARISRAMGRLVLPEDPGKVVFLVGGIGITPVRSIIRDAAERGTGLEALLLYGNRSEVCVPYRAELESYSDKGTSVVHVFEHPTESWSGETGYITPELVKRYVDPEGLLFVTAGPPSMVKAMETCMDALGVEADHRLVERFGGYA